MKLNVARAAQASDQIEAQALPENHPSVPQLNSLFGEHTFFVNADGLNIVEPVGVSETGLPTAQVIKLAEWKDANRTSLVAHEPQPTDVVVTLSPEQS